MSLSREDVNRLGVLGCALLVLALVFYFLKFADFYIASLTGSILSIAAAILFMSDAKEVKAGLIVVATIFLIAAPVVPQGSSFVECGLPGTGGSECIAPRLQSFTRFFFGFGGQWSTIYRNYTFFW